jgi:hypothetical protein
VEKMLIVFLFETAGQMDGRQGLLQIVPRFPVWDFAFHTQFGSHTSCASWQIQPVFLVTIPLQSGAALCLGPKVWQCSQPVMVTDAAIESIDKK